LLSLGSFVCGALKGANTPFESSYQLHKFNRRFLAAYLLGRDFTELGNGIPGFIIELTIYLSSKATDPLQFEL